jgi:two-component system LytT family sensor kinase
VLFGAAKQLLKAANALSVEKKAGSLKGCYVYRMTKRAQVDWQRVGGHLAFWIAYLLYQALHEGWQHRDVLSFTLSPALLTDIFIAIGMAYINLYWLMKRYYYPHRYGRYAFALALLLLAGGVLARYCTYAIWVPRTRFHDPAMYLLEDKRFFIPIRIVKNAVEVYPVIALTMLIKLIRNSAQQERLLRALEQEKFSAELGLLKAQLHPHFFFNTLNSLYALTLSRSGLASGVVLRLADLMRYMLYEASARHVPLQAELTHLENYIGLEQLRFADHLDLSFSCSGAIQGKVIAPLLLLPFIENAFKHGPEAQAGWVTIDLKVIDQRLFLKVANSCPPLGLPRPGGLGLKNVKRRLELSYPGRHHLRVCHSAELFEADLRIDLGACLTT